MENKQTVKRVTIVETDDGEANVTDGFSSMGDVPTNEPKATQPETKGATAIDLIETN